MSHESTPGPDAEALLEERAARMAELEHRAARPPSVGVMPPVAAVALAGSLALLWLQAPDLGYYFSSRVPLELGAEGDFHFEAAQSNRYAQVHGTPTLRGVYWQEQGRTFVAVGLLDTPLLVKRTTLPSEDWTPGAKAPRPDQRPFQVRGRLLRRDVAARYEDAFREQEKAGEVKATWLLVADAPPGADVGVMAWGTLLAAFGAVNAWLLGKGVRLYQQRMAEWRARPARPD